MSLSFNIDEKKVFLEIYKLTEKGLSFEEASNEVMAEVRKNISVMQEILEIYNNNPEFTNRYNEYVFDELSDYIKKNNITNIKLENV